MAAYRTTSFGNPCRRGATQCDEAQHEEHRDALGVLAQRLQEPNHLLSAHRRELLQKPVNRVPGLQVVKKRSRRYPRPGEARGPVHDLGIDLYYDYPATRVR